MRAVAQWNVCRKHEAREAQVRSQGVAGETDMGRGLVVRSIGIILPSVQQLTPVTNLTDL